MEVGLGYWTKQPGLYIMATGSLSGLLFSPDWDYNLDLPEKIVFGRVLRRFRHIPLYYQYLCLYALIFPHRSFFSHFPIISTLIRVTWAIFPLVLLWYLPVHTILWLIGLILADTVHYLLDFKL
jgi:hypothetical protein